MAERFGLKEGDSRVASLEYLEQHAPELDMKALPKFSAEFLEKLVLDLMSKQSSIGKRFSDRNNPTRKMRATPADAIASIQEVLDESASLHEFDAYKRGVANMLTSHEDTPLEQAASLMRQRLSLQVRQLLERKTSVMIEIPKADPEKAVALLEMPYRAHQEADDAILPPRRQEKITAKAESDPWSGGVRVVRMIDSPAAIMDWLTVHFAVTAKDRVAEYWKVLLCNQFEGTLEGMMQEIEDAARKIYELTQGKTDLYDWEKGSHLTSFLMMKLPVSDHRDLNTYLFPDDNKEWGVIKKRAQGYAARLRIDALAQTTQIAMAATTRGRAAPRNQGQQGVKRETVSDDENSKGSRGSARQGKSSGGSRRSPNWRPGDERYDRWVKSQVCFNCDETGHLAEYCTRPQQQPVSQSFATACQFSPCAGGYGGQGHEGGPGRSTSTSSGTPPRCTSCDSMSSPRSEEGGGGKGRRASWGEGKEGVWLVRARNGRVRPE